MATFSGPCQLPAWSTKNKYLFVLLILCWSVTGYSQWYTDVSVQHTASPTQIEPGDTVTFTIRVFNEGATDLTGLSIKNELSITSTYISHLATPGTSYDPASGIWDIGNSMNQFTGFMELQVEVVIATAGVTYHLAQVQTLNETDVDSEAGNDFLAEDDIAQACVTVPHQICTLDGESVTLEAPAGYTSYEWYLDNGNGMELISTEAIFVATAPGNYSFTVNDNACTTGSCCPVILEESCITNQPPVAWGDEVSTPPNTPIDIFILDNDGDPDGDLDTNSVVVTDPPSNGTVTVNPNGTITYTPDTDFSGPDTLIYEVCDDGMPVALCDTAIVIINVGPLYFDLSLSKSLAPGQVTPVSIGDEVNYVLTVTNEGVFTASNIEITDHLPVGLILSPNNTGWTLNQFGDAVYTIGQPLEPGASVSVGISLLVTYAATGQNILNVGEITGATDQNGSFIADVDSTPANGDVLEDDQDSETIELIPHDPTGYIYCEKTGMIITGGTISVEGPGEVYILQDGIEGYYEFYTDGTPGIYTLSYTHPEGFIMGDQCLPQPGSFDPTGLPSPYVLGGGADGDYLADTTCTANPYYLSFDVEPGDPIIYNNNIPVQCGYIGSIVCADDGDGVASGDEPGMPGVPVYLYDCADTLNPILIALTDSNGNYAFDGLPQGNYMVQFELPPNSQFLENDIVNDFGYTDCISLGHGECDTSKSVCILVCPFIDAGPDLEICLGEETEIMASLPYGSGAVLWSPPDGLSDPEALNPVASPMVTTTYIVSYEDAIGCMDQDTMTVVVTYDCLPDIIGEDSVTIVTDCDAGDPLYCFNVPYAELGDYSFELNGEPYAAEFGPCDYLQDRYYTYGSLLGFGTEGPYRLEYWNVNGVPHSGDFQNMDELTQMMNQWDPSGTWTHNESGKSIVGGLKQNFYSKMTIRHLVTGSVATLDLYSLYAQNSSYLVVPEGEQTLVVTHVSGAMDTVHIRSACVTPDYVELTMPVGQIDTICLSMDELEGPITAIFNPCLQGFDNPADLSVIDGTNCVEILAMYTGETETCYVICDETGICDTTYVLITVYDEDFHLVEDSLCTPKDVAITGEVLLNDQIPGDIVSLNILQQPGHGTLIVNPDGTITYIPDDGYCNDAEDEPLDLFVYEVCTQFECQSTTVTVQVKCDGLVIYNGFSPNGDGINDFFKIDGLQAYENHKLMVFNRWGNKVFQSEDYDNDWDGFWEDLRLPVGTYFYLLHLEDEDRWLSGYLQIWW